ncbi:hypothetical protein CYMTET_20340 [Cymbomonas tetramitiformis]|uniref:Uncharacterized protein n=1 Tax=Cymbomonas tetramitiformis TaxID=36881 RepID=A0AAE0G4G9_9CHLO|nr:hypothetical protein CYMTET_20340 [Cymbomonas tetramitiformis]
MCIAKAINTTCAGMIGVESVDPARSVTNTIKVSVRMNGTKERFDTVIVHMDGRRVARFDDCGARYGNVRRDVDRHAMRVFARFMQAICVTDDVPQRMVACMCMRNMDAHANEFVCGMQDSNHRAMLVTRTGRAQERLEPLLTVESLKNALGVYAELFRHDDFVKVLGVRKGCVLECMQEHLRRIRHLDVAGHHVQPCEATADAPAAKVAALRAINRRFGMTRCSEDLLLAFVACVLRDWLCDRASTHTKRTPLICFRSITVMRAFFEVLYDRVPDMIDRNQLRVSSVRAHRLTTQSGSLLYKGEIDGATTRALYSMATNRSVNLNRSVTSLPCDTDRMIVAVHDPKLRAFVSLRDVHDDNNILLCEDQCEHAAPLDANANLRVLRAVRRVAACVLYHETDRMLRADCWRDVQTIIGPRRNNAAQRMAWFSDETTLGAFLQSVHDAYGMRGCEALELISIVRQHVSDHRTNRRAASMPCVLTKECCNRTAPLARKRVMDIATDDGNAWVVPHVRLIRNAHTDRYQLQQVREVRSSNGVE